MKAENFTYKHFRIASTSVQFDDWIQKDNPTCISFRINFINDEGTKCVHEWFVANHCEATAEYNQLCSFCELIGTNDLKKFEGIEVMLLFPIFNEENEKGVDYNLICGISNKFGERYIIPRHHFENTIDLENPGKDIYSALEAYDFVKKFDF